MELFCCPLRRPGQLPDNENTETQFLWRDRGFLFDYETYAFYNFQLCFFFFYQMAVKHTGGAPSFVPALTVCTVPHGAVAPCVCMFAHGGRITSRAGFVPLWEENTGVSPDTMCHGPFCLPRSLIVVFCRTSPWDQAKIKHDAGSLSSSRR